MIDNLIDKTEKRHENSVILAQLSNLAYKTKEEIENECLQWQLDELCIFDTGITKRQNKGDFGFVATKGNNTVIAFRGTQKDDLVDWFADLSIKKVRMGKRSHYVHKGFKKAFTRIWNNKTFMQNCIRRKFRENPNTKLWITGHSLGGAMAVICLYRLIIEHGDNIRNILGQISTFGQPRVVNYKLKRYLEKKYKIFEKYYRYDNNDDIVPAIPKKGYITKTGYWHFGLCFRFNEEGEMKFFRNSEKSIIFDQSIRVEDHNMKKYEKLMTQNV